MWVTGGYTVAVVGGVALAVALHTSTASGVNIACGILFGVAIFVAGAVMSFGTHVHVDQTLREWLDVWIFAGTQNLRKTFQVRTYALKESMCILWGHLNAFNW